MYPWNKVVRFIHQPVDAASFRITGYFGVNMIEKIRIGASIPIIVEFDKGSILEPEIGVKRYCGQGASEFPSGFYFVLLLFNIEGKKYHDEKGKDLFHRLQVWLTVIKIKKIGNEAHGRGYFLTGSVPIAL